MNFIGVCFVCAFFVLARKSILAATSKKELLEKKFLLRKDVDKGDYLVVQMRSTKIRTAHP